MLKVHTTPNEYFLPPATAHWPSWTPFGGNLRLCEVVQKTPMFRAKREKTFRDDMIVLVVLKTDQICLSDLNSEPKSFGLFAPTHSPDGETRESTARAHPILTHRHKQHSYPQTQVVYNLSTHSRYPCCFYCHWQGSREACSEWATVCRSCWYWSRLDLAIRTHNFSSTLTRQYDNTTTCS